MTPHSMLVSRTIFQSFGSRIHSTRLHSTRHLGEHTSAYLRLSLTAWLMENDGELLNQFNLLKINYRLRHGIDASCLPPTQFPRRTVGRRRPRSLCFCVLNCFGWQRPSLLAFPIASWTRRGRQGVEGRPTGLVRRQVALGSA